ncbi:hypothetical protein [Levilactobacillus sp. FUA 3915]|uniref:hypothetical protein n=1 Tax=Levilactobacillus sp. FUA 3915 TaxID=3411093 RepID=UPI0037580414
MQTTTGVAENLLRVHRDNSRPLADFYRNGHIKKAPVNRRLSVTSAHRLRSV